MISASFGQRSTMALALHLHAYCSRVPSDLCLYVDVVGGVLDSWSQQPTLSIRQTADNMPSKDRYPSLTSLILRVTRQRVETLRQDGKEILAVKMSIFYRPGDVNLDLNLRLPRVARASLEMPHIWIHLQFTTPHRPRKSQTSDLSPRPSS